MKKFEFETSKGKFILNEEGKGISLKEITEEQASEILGSNCFSNTIFYHRNKLYYLLKSKGIHLYKNPYEGIFIEDNPTSYEQAAPKTFYNPYIFKIK